MKKHALYRSGLFLLLVLAVGLPGCRSTTAGGSADWLNNPLAMADQTYRFAGDEAFLAGRASNGRIVVNDGYLQPTFTGRPGPGGPARWHWQTRPIETAIAFTELLPSWNVVAESGGLKLMVRTRDQTTGQWSDWLYVGSWGETSDEGKDAVDSDYGEVKVDYLVLDQPADAFELRVVFEGHPATPAGELGLRKLVAVVSGPSAWADACYIAPPASLPGASHANVQPMDEIDLNVPYRSQQVLPEALRSRTCSPTSTSMVIAYRGVDLTTLENAERIFDAEYDIYGNWGRAVARAGELGLDAELVRFRTWGQVRATLTAGQPIIASIRFGKGEFPSNPMSSTNGHLIVIRGLTAEGDAIVNDPAFREGGDGIVYAADELARAWLGHGGVGYLIGPPAPRPEHIGRQ